MEKCLLEAELAKLDICENPPVPKQDLDENLKEENAVKNNPDTYMLKEIKSKHGITYSKPSCYTKIMKLPHSRGKFVPASHLTDSSAKVVLSERNFEIKDLESKVKFLKSKIKELENENRTLQNLQSRQERELKKFKERITDIPALLKSHKEEIKVYESTISSIRKELRDCQKELKLRNESLLKKENQVDKLNNNLKQHEETIYKYSVEIKELKAAQKNLEDENKVLTKTNENLKNENDDLCNQVKDLNNKVWNMEENVNEEKDLNRSLKNELSELKEKYDERLMQVSVYENMPSCRDQVHSSTVTDVSDKAEDCMKNATEKLSMSVVNDSSEQNLYCVKSIDKSKDGLTYDFKSFQQCCNSQSKDSVTRLFEIRSNNVKLLPPLKTTSQESSTSIISDFRKRRQSLTADIIFTDCIKPTECDVSVQEKLIAVDCEHKISENKANISCDAIINGKSNFIDFSLSDEDDSKDWLKKNYQCVKNSYMNEFKESESSSFISKDITETKINSSLSNPFKIHDNFLCENFQTTLKNNGVPNKNLEHERCSHFSEASKNVSKSWENSINCKNIECKSIANKYNFDTSKCKSTFLKQPINLKPSTSCQFDKLSLQKSSRTQFDLSGWNK